MQTVSALVLGAVLLLSASPAIAKVASVSLPELVQLSDQVVIGRVLRLHRVSGLQIAEVEVVETLKGDSRVSRVFFLAQPTWICDITEAEPEETALLFLVSRTAPSNSRTCRRAMESSERRPVASGAILIGCAQGRPSSW